VASLAAPLGADPGALGISEPLPEEAWRAWPREISDELEATPGACLSAVRRASLAELAAAAGASISDVWLALRRLAEQVEPTGMQVYDEPASLPQCPSGRGSGSARLPEAGPVLLSLSSLPTCNPSTLSRSFARI
jgi:hypothetical protein